MGKLTTYLVIMSGLVLLFYFTGLLSDCTGDEFCEGTTANSKLLDLLLKPGDMPSRGLSVTDVLILALEGVVAAGIAIGLFFAGKPDLALAAPMSVLLFNILWDFLAVITKVSQVNKPLALLIFAPLMFLFIVTIFEWWRGRD